MDVVDVDLLAVLPVSASASAGFARAVDFSRDRDERQEHLRPLMTTLASGEPSTFVVVDAIGAERGCVCRPQRRCPTSAASWKMIASRPAQAGLIEITEKTSGFRRPVPPFVQGGPCGG